MWRRPDPKIKYLVSMADGCEMQILLLCFPQTAKPGPLRALSPCWDTSSHCHEGSQAGRSFWPCDPPPSSRNPEAAQNHNHDHSHSLLKADLDSRVGRGTEARSLRSPSPYLIRSRSLPATGLWCRPAPSLEWGTLGGAACGRILRCSGAWALLVRTRSDTELSRQNPQGFF